jgi:hypothetical protein
MLRDLVQSRCKLVQAGAAGTNAAEATQHGQTVGPGVAGACDEVVGEDTRM